MPVIEFEGKTTEEAIEKACNQLHMSSDELKFEIISTGSSGIFGLGGKKAAIRVNVEEKISAKKPEPPREEERREDTRERFEREKRRTFEESDYEERGRREERSENRETRPPREKRERKRPRRDNGGEEIKIPENVPLPPTMVGPDEEKYEGPEDEVMTMAREILEGIMERMEIEGSVKTTRIGQRVILEVEGENSGLLIGKKGATLDAMQFLINKIVNRTRQEKNRIIVDTENYRVRRHQSLIELAQRMAEKATRNRRPVTISQLSAHDRRVVHLALQESPGLKTRSRGEGPMKNIVIIPGNRKGKGDRGPRQREDH